MLFVWILFYYFIGLVFFRRTALELLDDEKYSPALIGFTYLIAAPMWPLAMPVDVYLWVKGLFKDKE